MTSQKTALPIGDAAPPPPAPRRADILLVGLGGDDARTLPPRLLGALASGTVAVELDDLTDDRLSGALAILAPVVGRRHDIADVAARLGDAGYAGRFIAFATDFADETVIRDEILSLAPRVSFDIVRMGHGPRLAAI